LPCCYDEAVRRKGEKKTKSQPPARRSRLAGWVALAIAIALGAAGWLVLVACGRGSAPGLAGSRPNVLLISIDTLRADHLGAYGAKAPTPVLDRLAAEGVLFEKAVSHVPITLPSHASLLTGRYPILHGVRDNGAFRLAETQTTIAESLKATGYQTGAFVGSFALDSRFGLDQGFDLYDDFYGDTSEFNDFAISERPAAAVLERAALWIEGRSATGWLAFVHLYDPHAPYLPPASFTGDPRSDPYTREVLYVDDALGRFLDRLRSAGKLEQTLIVVTGDHGEGLGEHGEKTHGMFAYDSTLHVPLILSWGGRLPQGRRISSRARLIDLAPTLAELAGTDPGGYQGESLLPLLGKPEPAEDRESYFEAVAFNLNRNWAPLTGFYRRKLKYIELPLAELYDLEADPGETRNLAEIHPGTLRQMGEALARYVNQHSTEQSRAIETTEVDEETIARLKTLGYVVAADRTSKRPERYTPDDDPKRLVALSDMLDEGVAAHLAGRPQEAIRIFREILKRRPNFTNVHVNLAYVLRESGRLEEAIAVLEQAMTAGLTTRTLLGRLGLYLQEAGRLQESAVLLESAIKQDPSHAEAYNYLAVTYARLGRTANAVSMLEKLLTLDSSYASAYSNRGSVYLGAREYVRAAENFRRALEIDPRLASAWNGLGVVQATEGRKAEAISSWKRSIELDPRQYDTLYNLGTLLTQLNRFEEAIGYLDRFVQTAPVDRYGADIPKVKRLLAELRARV